MTKNFLQCCFRMCALVTCAATVSLFPRSACALPFEDFAMLSRRTYRVYGEVEESYRNATSIGSLLTIEIPYNERGERLQFGGPGGEGFTATSTPSAPLFMRLSWDGESAVRVTSGAGLGCIDLTSEKASAFILSDFSFSQACPDGGYECPFVEVQLKVFDGSDPTGQRYSAGVVRRRVVNQKKDLMIPFSQLVREGPEGPWKPSCVGALTLTVLSVPNVTTTVFMRSLGTNGNCKQPLSNGRPACSGVGGTRPSPGIFPPAVSSEQEGSVLASDPVPAPEVVTEVTIPTPDPAAPVVTATPKRATGDASPPRQKKKVSEIDEMFDDLGEELLHESGRMDEVPDSTTRGDSSAKVEMGAQGSRARDQRVLGSVTSR